MPDKSNDLFIVAASLMSKLPQEFFDESTSKDKREDMICHLLNLYDLVVTKVDERYDFNVVPE